MVTPRLFSMILVGCFALGAASWADPPNGEDAQAARTLVSTVIDDAGHRLSQPMTPQQRLATVKALTDQYGDLGLTSQDILGHYWTKASTTEQTDFVGLVFDYLIGSWAKYLKPKSGPDSGSDHHIDVVGTESAANGRVLVHSLAVSSSDRIPVDWLVARNPSGRSVVADVSVSGISIVETLRGDFTSVIRANNGRIGALLSALRQKIAGYRDAAR